MSALTLHPTTTAWPDLQDVGMRHVLRCWAEWRQPPASNSASGRVSGGRMAPRRSDIDPVMLRHCLPNIWIFRLDADL
ncbi:MAG: PAS domain-containing protein [Alphaproteobacteria bacterium]|nr:PAS domain-containing protein [Alphaproteobacteria bacterium]